MHTTTNYKTSTRRLLIKQLYRPLYTFVDYKSISLPPHRQSSPAKYPNQTTSPTLPPYSNKGKLKQWNFLRKIKSTNYFPIHSKFHVNNQVYIFKSIYICFKLFHQTLRSLVTPYHPNTTKFSNIYTLTLFFLYLHFIAGLKYIRWSECLQLLCPSKGA